MCSLRQARSSVRRDVERAAKGFTDADLVLTSMAVFDTRKAVANLVVGFSLLAQEFPNAKLVLVGDRPGAYSSAIAELITRLNLDERVRMEPVLEDPSNWYAVSDVMISASDIESFPRSMIEAMAWRLPIAATRVFGVPELIIDGELGWLFEPRTLDSLVAAMRRVFSSTAEEREAIRDRAQELVEREYDSAGYARHFHELLSSLAANPPSPPR